MKALVLEKANKISLRDIEISEPMGPYDVKIAIKAVGICGSDIHYYQHGGIGDFKLKEPMVLGHEASGQILEVGKEVKNLKEGDRVCMEPGIPDWSSKASRLGMYNLDPSVRFWATPPIHGCLRPTVIHPAALTFKLPDNVTYEEGALVEPLAVGMHAVNKANIKAGDIAVVMGAGTIGLATTLSALAGGCSQVIISDLKQFNLEIAADWGSVIPVNIANQDLVKVVMEKTNNWGADIVFEASGSEKAIQEVLKPVCPGGRIILIGMPGQPVPFDIVGAQAKEARIETVFRYAHVYPRILTLMEAGKIKVKSMITNTFEFNKSVEAFDFAVKMNPETIKVQIVFPE